MTTKNHTLSALLLLLALAGGSVMNAQMLNWKWAHGTGLTGEDMAESIAVDDSGYVYATGSYTSATITFGNFTLTNAGAGTADIVLVKYNAAGSVIWAKTFGDVDGDLAHGISLDNAGNIYLTGWFASPMVTMGSQVLVNSNAGTADIFIAKLNPVGQTFWAKTAGGSGADVGYSIAADSAGNTYLTGTFSSATATFGSTVLTNAGGSAADLFVARYSSTGSLVWAKGAGGTGSDVSYACTTDHLGNGYFTGWFSSASITLGTHTINNGGGQDLFAAKFDANGNSIWAKSVGSTGQESSTGIVTDAAGQAYLTGSFDSPTLPFGTSTLTNNGGADFLLLKLDASGQPLWARSTGAQYDEAGTSLVLSPGGDLYVSGKYFSPAITFGGNTLTNINAGAFDLFVAQYDASGNDLWCIGAAGVFQDIPNAMAMSSAGHVYMAGKYDSPTLTFGSSIIYKGCGNDFFVSMLEITSVGIQETETEILLLTYPNPVVDGIVHLPAGPSFETAVITDITGKVIRTTSRLEGIIDMRQEPPGYYLLRLFGAEGERRARVLLR